MYILVTLAPFTYFVLSFLAASVVSPFSLLSHFSHTWWSWVCWGEAKCCVKGAPHKASFHVVLKMADKLLWLPVTVCLNRNTIYEFSNLSPFCSNQLLTENQRNKCFIPESLVAVHLKVHMKVTESLLCAGPWTLKASIIKEDSVKAWILLNYLLHNIDAHVNMWPQHETFPEDFCVQLHMWRHLWDTISPFDIFI